MNIEERSRVALNGGHINWRDTPIKNWDRGSLAADVRRLSGAEWWKRGDTEQARELNRLLERAGLGPLRDEESEVARYRAQHSVGGPDVEEVVAAQREKEKTGVDELSPNESESIVDWFGRIAKTIDFGGRKKPLIDAVRTYAARFHGSLPARKTLDAKLIRTFLQRAVA